APLHGLGGPVQAARRPPASPARRLALRPGPRPGGDPANVPRDGDRGALPHDLGARGAAGSRRRVRLGLTGELERQGAPRRAGERATHLALVVEAPDEPPAVAAQP